MVDVDRGRLASAAAKHKVTNTFTDYRKMYDAVGKEIDAVTIATPDHNHACAAMMALRRVITPIRPTANRTPARIT